MSALNETLQYNKPWILQRADPYVYKAPDGLYYLRPPFPPMTGLCFAAPTRSQALQTHRKRKCGTNTIPES